MKIAYLIFGPESSGNRMMAKAVESAYSFDGGAYSKNTLDDYQWTADWQKSDSLDESLRSAPDRIIYIRSIPTGTYPNKKFVNIESICKIVQEHGYKIFPILMSRDFIYTAMSQVKRMHVNDKETAIINISMAYKHIIKSLGNVKLFPIIMQYELFVEDEDYRSFICEYLDIGPISIPLFNANEKYTNI